ncbi:MAG: tRNA(His) guanylyltransferase Thg1 family protein [Halobacteriota archaeon]
MKTRTRQRYKSDKDRAIYAEIKTYPPLIVRVDGRKFKHVMRDNDFKKPYGERFARSMAESY